MSSDQVIVPSATVPKKRSVGEIESELDAARDRLGSTINELQELLAPQAVVNRGLDKAKGYFTDEHGAVRKDRVAKVVGGVVATAVAVRLGRGAIRAVFGSSKQDIVYVPVPRSQIGQFFQPV